MSVQASRPRLVDAQSAQSWIRGLAALRDSVAASRAGPRICLYGRCGAGKSTLVNCLVGWELVPRSARSGTDVMALTQRSIELTATDIPGEAPDAFRIYFTWLSPQQWAQKKLSLLIDAAVQPAASSEVAREADKVLQFLYGESWRVDLGVPVFERDAAGEFPTLVSQQAELAEVEERHRPEDDVHAFLEAGNQHEIYGDHAIEGDHGWYGR